MKTTEDLTQFINNKGIATTSQILKEQFSHHTIRNAVNTGKIDKLTRGVYSSTEIIDDAFAAITYRWKKCVISHNSALYLADLTDRTPHILDVTIPSTYKPPASLRNDPDIRIHKAPPHIYPLGITEVKTPMGGDGARIFYREGGS